VDNSRAVPLQQKRETGGISVANPEHQLGIAFERRHGYHICANPLGGGTLRCDLRHDDVHPM
jgi:hypothetical protein